MVYCIYRGALEVNVCVLLCAGPHVDMLTVEKVAEYSKVARDSVDEIVDVWGAAGGTLNTFFFERIGDNDDYSYLIDSGTTIYKVEVEATDVSDEMTVKVTRFQ